MNGKQLFHLVLFRAWCELKSDASRYYLGVLWWFIEPVVYMSVFYFVFELVIQLSIEDYVSFLLIGLVVWRWFATVVAQSVACITNNAGLINQVYLPKYVFPLIVVVVDTFRFLLVFAMLLIYLAVDDAPVGAALRWLPAILSVELTLILACAFLLASLHPFLPDIKKLVDNGLTLLFFLSGVFFQAQSKMEALGPFFDFNPMTILINSYRGVLLGESTPDVLALSLIFFASCGLSCLGYTLLRRFDRLYVKLSML